jgi:hypothetical protein
MTENWNSLDKFPIDSELSSENLFLITLDYSNIEKIIEYHPEWFILNDYVETLSQ